MGDEVDEVVRANPGFEVRFDHVALVLHRMTDCWPILAEALGGRYQAQGLAPGYSWMQLDFANGFTIETLHPEEIYDDDEPVEQERTSADHRGEFARRFLDRRGPGPHHVTFIVDDLDAAMAALAGAGLRPGVLDRSDPLWQEAIYSAEVAHGVVLQVVQADGTSSAPPDPPEGFPELGYDHPVASFGRAVHAVVDLDGALGIYRDALGGVVTSSGAAVDGNHWVELGWSGPGRLRLLEAKHSEMAAWVGDRPGRMRHLYFTFDDPESVPGARLAARGRWVLESDDTLGVRIVLGSAAR